MPAVYAQNLLCLADTATGSGISYSILDVQCTKEFGSRTLENLIDLSHGGTDGQGNLLGDEDYLFLTIQFTNITDQTVEIQRNQGGLRGISSEGEVLHYDSEAVYCDKKWEGALQERYSIGCWIRMNPSPAKSARLYGGGMQIPENCC